MDNNGSNVIDSSGVWFYALDKDKKVTRQFNGYSTKYTLQKGEVYILFRTHMKYQEYIDYNYKMMISTSPINQYIPNRLTKTTILLPTQLQKIGDVADTLYWDIDKNRYIVKKNISTIRLNGSEQWGHELKTDNYYRATYFIPGATGVWNKPSAISNRFNYNENTAYYGEQESIAIDGNGQFYICLDKSRINTNDFTMNDFKYWLSKNPVQVYYQLSNPILIETNTTQPIKIPTYDEKTYIYIDSKNNINPTLKVTIDRLPQIAKEAVAQAEVDNTNHNIALARMYINMLPESSYKDQLQEQLSEIFSSDMVLDKKTTTANLDLYIKCENILQMSLSTNSITFEDFSGIEDMVEENTVQISINSSLPYSLNAYLPTEIQNSDKSVTMDKDILNIKENSESVYQTFTNTTDKIILKDNCNAGNNLIHGVDIKLKGGIAHEKDVYKTTIKFEAQQK